MGGHNRECQVYIGCGAEIIKKIGVKSTVFELQKSLKYKSSSLINFQINETIFLQKSRFPGFSTKIRYSRRKLIEGKSHFSYNPLLDHSALPPKPCHTMS